MKQLYLISFQDEGDIYVCLLNIHKSIYNFSVFYFVSLEHIKICINTSTFSHKCINIAFPALTYKT